MKHTPYIFAALLLMVAGCQEEALPVTDPFDAPDGEIPFRLNMAGVGPATKGMLFGEETTSISGEDMQLLCFDKSGYYIGIRQAHIEGSQFWGYVPDGTARIHFVANASLPDPLPYPVGTSERVIMQSDELTTPYTNTTVTLWGYHLESSAATMKDWLRAGLTASEGGSSSPAPNTVHLLRDRARVTLSFDAGVFEDVRFGFGTEVYTENVASVEWTVTNGRDRGYIAPYSTTGSNPWAGYCNAAGTVSTVSMNEYTGSGRYQATAGSFQSIDIVNPAANPSYLYLFDDSNSFTHSERGRVRLVLKVTSVNGKEKYILILLRDGDGNQIQITRNNTYILNIKSLDHEGYASFDMAVSGDSDDFANAPADVDSVIPKISNGSQTLTLVSPAATSILVNTPGQTIRVEYEFMAKDSHGADVQGETNPAAFALYWEDNINSGWDINEGWDINNPGASDDLPTFNSTTGRWEFDLTISTVGHAYAYNDYLVIRHKKTGLSRSVHVYAVDEFKFRGGELPAIEPVIVGGSHYSGPDGETAEPVYQLTMRLSQSLQSDLFPISIWFATTNMEPYNAVLGYPSGNEYQSRSSLFGVTLVSTAGYFPSSSLNSDWNYNAASWGFWYELKLDSYPEDGFVTVYFKDNRSLFSTGSSQNLGLYTEIDTYVTGEELNLFRPYCVVENPWTHEFELDKTFIKTGVITFINDPSGWGWDPLQWHVHYWGGAETADADLVPVMVDSSTQLVETKDVGYWGTPQDFYIYTVGIPMDATGFKVWHDAPSGESAARWFGADGNATTQRKAWVFNYDGDKVLYE